MLSPLNSDICYGSNEVNKSMMRGSWNVWIEWENYPVIAGCSEQSRTLVLFSSFEVNCIRSLKIWVLFQWTVKIFLVFLCCVQASYLGSQSFCQKEQKKEHGPLHHTEGEFEIDAVWKDWIFSSENGPGTNDSWLSPFPSSTLKIGSLNFSWLFGMNGIK